MKTLAVGDEIIFSWLLIKHLEKSLSLHESECANEAEGVMMTVIGITEQYVLMHQIVDERNDTQVKSLNTVSTNDRAVKLYLCCLFTAQYYFTLFHQKDTKAFCMI